MGGPGSGLRPTKLEVRDCRALSIAELCDGVRRCEERCGEVRWLRHERLRARLSYTITQDGGRTLFAYCYWPQGEGPCFEDVFVLQSARGRGSLALCPMTGCGRRVRTLYAPPGAALFRCRTCWGLVYRASPVKQALAEAQATARPLLCDLEALPEGPLSVPRHPRRGRISEEYADCLAQELPLGPQELRLWSLRLRQKGLSYRSIAAHLECSKSSVARFCQAGRAGIDAEALVRERWELCATPIPIGTLRRYAQRFFFEQESIEQRVVVPDEPCEP